MDLDLTTNPFFTYGIDKLCTICHLILKDTDRTHSIFSKLEGLESAKNALQVLQSFSNFNIYDDPLKLCTTCYDKIIAVYTFIQMCNKAHENLQNYLKYEKEITTRSGEEVDKMDVDLKREEIDILPTRIKVDARKYLEEMGYQKTSKTEGIIMPITKIKIEEIILQEGEGIENEATNKIEERALKEEMEDKEEAENEQTADTEKENANDESSISDGDYDTDSDIELGNKRSKKNMSQEKISSAVQHHQGSHSNDFFSSQYNDNHLLIHTTTNPHKYEICNKTFLHGSSLKAHESTYSNDGPFICQHCGMAFKLSKELIRHIMTHSTDCEICNEDFRCRGDLKSHEISHSDDKPFICQQCGRVYKSLKQLHRHLLRIHATKRPHKCEICNKTFSDRTIFQIHQSSHSDDRPFICQHCGTAFKLSQHLTRHLKIHSTNEKPYKCEICNKAFITRSILKGHQNIHSNKTQFICKDCGKAFLERRTLKKHQATHEKPYKCTKCSLSCKTQAGLNRHNYSAHSKSVSEKV